MSMMLITQEVVKYIARRLTHDMERKKSAEYASLILLTANVELVFNTEEEGHGVAASGTGAAAREVSRRLFPCKKDTM